MYSRRIPAKIAVAVVFIAANFMAIMDTTIVNVALPTVGHDFGVDPSGLSAVNVGYLVALAVFIPASGWLGNRFGTRRTMLAALLLFTLASGLCATAGSLGELTAYRVLQGIAGGLLTPVGMTMMLRAFPLAERLRAQKYMMLPTAVAPALGPVLGGWLVDAATWHWVFLVNLPVGALALVFGLLFLPDLPGGARSRFDLAGFVLAGAGLASVLYALTEGANRGWGSAGILVPLVGGTVLLAAMAGWELRTENPMINLRIAKDRLFRTTQLALLPINATFMGVLYLYPLFLQTALGYDALHSGLATFPEALGMMTASQTVPRLYDRIGPRRLMAAGGTGAALLMALMATFTPATGTFVFYPLLYLLGVCVGHHVMTAQNTAFATVPPARTGDATTVLNMQRQTGAAFGTALVGTLLAVLGTTTADGGVDTTAYHVGFVTLGALTLCSALLALRINDNTVRAAFRAAAPGAEKGTVQAPGPKDLEGRDERDERDGTAPRPGRAD